MHKLVAHLRILLMVPLLIARVHLIAHCLLLLILNVKLDIHMIAVVNIHVDVLVWLDRMGSWRPSVLHVLLADRVTILIVLIMRVHFTYFDKI